MVNLQCSLNVRRMYLYECHATASFVNDQASVPQVHIAIEGGAESRRAGGQDVATHWSRSRRAADKGRISIRVYLTASVLTVGIAFIDPKNPLTSCELTSDRSFGGVPLPPEVWKVAAVLDGRCTDHV